ncbi:MAG: hypothetical protein AAB581_01240 [Patescibacteria group bacterium]
MKQALSAVFFIVAVITVPAFASAAVVKSGEKVDIGKNERIAENIYVAGGTLTISGTIDGDLLAVGGTLTISGPVRDDVAVAGGTVHIASDIGGDARVAGGNVTIDGTIGGDLAVAGGNIVILPDTVIAGDLMAAGGNITNQGTVKGKISIFTQPPPDKEKIRAARFLGMGIWWLATTLAMLLAGLLLYYVLRPGTQEVVRKAVNGFWFEMLRGFLVLIAMPAALVILAITVVGIPFTIAGFLLYIPLLMLSCVMGAVILGATVAKYGFKKPEVLTPGIMFGGIILYQILKLIPVVGWLVVFAFFLAGLGVVSHALFRQTILKWRE